MRSSRGWWRGKQILQAVQGEGGGLSTKLNGTDLNHPCYFVSHKLQSLDAKHKLQATSRFPRWITYIVFDKGINKHCTKKKKFSKLSQQGAHSSGITQSSYLHVYVFFHFRYKIRFQQPKLCHPHSTSSPTFFSNLFAYHRFSSPVKTSVGEARPCHGWLRVSCVPR